MASEILQQAQHFLEIAQRHHAAALDRTSNTSLLENARLLGLAFRGEVFAESTFEYRLIGDISIYFSRHGRSTAFERYARSVSFPPDSAEAQVLSAMRRARFSIWQVEGFLEAGGMIVSDQLRKRVTWLVDPRIEAEPGAMFTARLCHPAEFAIPCSVVVALDEYEFGEAMLGCPKLLRHASTNRLAKDPQLCVAIYRALVGSRSLAEPVPA